MGLEGWIPPIYSSRKQKEFWQIRLLKKFAWVGGIEVLDGKSGLFNLIWNTDEFLISSKDEWLIFLDDC